MTTFNRILRDAGIDPREVALLRHQTERGGLTPWHLWESRRDAFLRYQSTQHDSPIFHKRYWASFVSPAKYQTLFVGLFEAEIRPEIEIDWTDALGGGEVGEGRDAPYFYFQCSLAEALSEHVGLLRIEWGDAVRQWRQYAHLNDKPVIAPLRRRAGAQPPVRGPDRPSPLERTFALLGFERRHRTMKVTMLEDSDGILVYLKNQTARCPVVIHPYYEPILDRLRDLPGIVPDERRPFYVNSNLAAFPVYRDPGRATSSRYGIALEARDAASIAGLVVLLRENRLIRTPLGDVTIGEREPHDGPTDREARSLARIGQGQFRLDLNQIWNWRCAVTGVALQELLRASHIKPWHRASDSERLDPYNGLLLAAHVDALFDRHLISFDDDGRLLCSPRITASELGRIGIDPQTCCIAGLHDRHRRYLADHRKHLSRHY